MRHPTRDEIIEVARQLVAGNSEDLPDNVNDGEVATELTDLLGEVGLSTNDVGLEIRYLSYVTRYISTTDLRAAGYDTEYIQRQLARRSTPFHHGRQWL